MPGKTNERHTGGNNISALSIPHLSFGESASQWLSTISVKMQVHLKIVADTWKLTTILNRQADSVEYDTMHLISL